MSLETMKDEDEHITYMDRWQTHAKVESENFVRMNNLRWEGGGEGSIDNIDKDMKENGAWGFRQEGSNCKLLLT